jgi:hypothetical protein
MMIFDAISNVHNIDWFCGSFVGGQLYRPSGYFQITGYRLRLVNRNDKTEIAVVGTVVAMADCKGAVILFDVLDKNDNKVGEFKVAHGEFERHDAWELGAGALMPIGDAAETVANADHVFVREADCS